MEFDHLPVTRAEQNCSILWCEATSRAAIIDPGGDIDRILSYIDLLEVQPEVILVTHGHFDHCGGVAKLAAATGARIEGPHQGDADLIRDVAHTAERYGYKADSFVPDRWLCHGDRVSFGHEVLEVLHCPGHSYGHVAYFNAAARQAFVGDILFYHAIGGWRYSDGNLALLIDSIRNKLFALGDDVAFLPGHGRSSTFGHERSENPFVGDKAIAAWTRRAISENGIAAERDHDTFPTRPGRGCA